MYNTVYSYHPEKFVVTAFMGSDYSFHEWDAATFSSEQDAKEFCALKNAQQEDDYKFIEDEI